MVYQLLPSIFSYGSRVLSPIVRNFNKRKQMGKAEIIPDKQIGYGGAAGTAGTEGTKRGLLSSIFDKQNRGLLAITGPAGIASLAMAFSGEPETPEATPPSDNRNVVLPDPEKDVDPRLLQVLFPNIGGKATNKELINAAILRASLEMLKPRATNENFASSAQRAITAGATVGTQNIGIYPTARAARQAGIDEGFTEVEVYQKDTGFAYKGTYDPVYANKPTKKTSANVNKIITPEVFEAFKAEPGNENFSDEEIINGLKQLGYTEGTE
jgi:hypothetical protein